MEPINLSDAEAWILEELSRHEKMNEHELINTIPREYLDNGDMQLVNAEKLLAIMADHGWIEYHSNAYNRGRHGVKINNSGYELLKRYRVEHSRLQDQIAELRAQTDTLRQLVDSAERRAKSAEEIATASQKNAEAATINADESKAEAKRSFSVAVISVIIAVLAWLAPIEILRDLFTAIASAIF